MAATDTNGASASEPDAIPLRERLILALDVETVDEAWDVVKSVTPEICFFKIGMQLQFTGGLGLANELIGSGKKVFLDSKLLDIENTISNSVKNIAKMNVSFLTIHGERKAIMAAVSAAQGTQLKILAISFLTNLVKEDLEDLGITEDVADFAQRRARIAKQAGADGIIGSGAEAHLLKREIGDGMFIASPGIRMASDARGDQARVAAPYTAISNGADYLVVGRPILSASDRKEKIAEIFCEIERGLAARAVPKALQAAE